LDSLVPVVYSLSTVTPELRDRVGDRALHLSDLLAWNSSKPGSKSLSKSLSKTVSVNDGQVVTAEVFAGLLANADRSITSIDWTWLRALDRVQTPVQTSVQTPVQPQQLRLSLSVAWNQADDFVGWEELLPDRICPSEDTAIQEAVLQLWNLLFSRKWKYLWDHLALTPATLPIALIIQPHSPGPHLTGWITQYSKLQKDRLDRWHIRGDRLSLEQRNRLKTWAMQLPDLWDRTLNIQWSLDPNNQFWIVAVIPGDPLLREAPNRIERYKARSQALEDSLQASSQPLVLVPNHQSIDRKSHRPVGTAHVLTHRLDRSLPQGTIAVMKELDPAWIPFLAQVSGIIVEQPGINHHGVILARELGIPMMLGIENATQDIQTGDRLVMRNDTVMPDLAPLPFIPDEKTPRQLPLLINLSQISRLGEVLPHIARHEVDGLGLIRSEWILLPEVAHAQDLQDPLFWRDLLRSRLTDLTQKLSQTFTELGVSDFIPNPLYYRCLPHPKGGLTLAPLQTELAALRELQDVTPHPLRLILPFVQTLEDFTQHHQEVVRYHFHPSTEVWMMAEVPAVVYLLDEFIEAGAQGIVIGLNDLTAWTLGIDRTAPLFYTSMASPHRAVIHAVQQIQQTTARYGIPCWLVLSCWSEAWVKIAIDVGITGLMVERCDWQRIAIALTSPSTKSHPSTK
jgi:phosphohistidine swiveling domain-containing protein